MRSTLTYPCFHEDAAPITGARSAPGRRAAEPAPTTGECHVWIGRAAPAGADATAAVLERYLGPRGRWWVDRGCAHCGDSGHGKPRIVESGRPSALRYSASRSGPVAVVAFTTDLDVGIDVEMVRPEFDWAEVAEDVLSPAEQVRMTEEPPPGRSRLFYEMWTAKEAVLKAEGLGLAGPVRDVDTTPGAAPWRGWRPHHLDLDLGGLGFSVVAAIAVSGPRPAVSLRRTEPLVRA